MQNTSRRQLIDQVKTKALLYGIDEKNDLEIQEQFGQLMINDKSYPLYMKPAFNSLKNQLKQKGYKQLVEEVAYTWFNRIIAIRYMEVHDYLPEKVNVLSSSVGRVDPDILFEYETMDLPVKQEEIRELLHAGDTEGAYRKLFIAQCNTLNSILPFLFEQIQDYTELLLPDFLLDSESVIKVLVQNDELTNSFDEIEVIGWLYQYYIAEEKDRVFAQKSKYKKEEIPFATQLFTPKWIVQYMVQNSLGRYWTESHREDEDLISNWEYFIKHEEEDFHEKIAPYVNKELRVEDIKLLDPAMGSGHILVYAFEVFHKIYEKCGYPERDIPRLIIENNLYGLDIDDRAYQLAAFAVVMKASSYSRRFLRSVEREGIQLNLASIQETNFISDSVIAYIAQEEEGERYNQVKAFFNQYENAKTYGSLIDITERDITFIEERLEHIQINPVEDLFYGEQHDIAKEVLPALVWQTKIMCNLYDIVVMNPPYMGIKNREENLNDFINKYYPNCKFDLYSAFIEKFSLSSSKTKILAAVTMQSWIYSPNFENFRLSIIENLQISQILSMDSMVMGIAFGTTATIFKQKFTDEEALFLKIKYPDLKNDKPDTFPNKSNLYKFIDIKKFKAIPYSPIAFDLPEEILLNYEKSPTLDKFGEGKFGLSTGDNEKFVRYWYEVCKDNVSIFNKNYKWIPLANGGEYRKWYGNNLEVINWMNNGEEIKNHPSSNIRNERFYFKEGITWTKLSSSKFGVRYLPSGFIFSGTSSSYFPYKTEDLTIVLAILSSNITKRILDSLNDTISYNIKDLLRIPIPKLNNEQSEIIKNIVKENIKISKQDWDSWEVSYDFSKHPLLYFKEDGYLSEIFKKRKSSTETQFLQLKKNEEYINQLFIELYKLNKELSYSVSDNDISLYKANEKSEAISLLSFYIGCLLGRYSLDVEGIAFAGGNWNPEKYGTFKANKGEIFQFTETSYFENDVIIRLREFLAVVYSSETVDENIQWLAEALEMKKGEDAEARLRRYFLDEFFADHCKMYQKCPIYWLVDSGKQKGLRTLLYMHRYQPDTIATIRFEHLQEIQAKYQNEINDLENRIVNPSLSASEKKKLSAEKTSFEKKMDELREFDKRLAEIANEEIEIDLDDGVKVNYEKFYRGGKGVLAKIK